MSEPVQVIMWKCPHCGNLTTTKTYAIKHLQSCVKNPEGKNCFVCKHQSAHNKLDLFNGNQVYYTCSKGKTCSRYRAAGCADFERKCIV